MSDERELKRARQACTNCRRKKTRCSGERPSCSYCVRLKQSCDYQSPKPTFSNGPANVPMSPLSLSPRNVEHVSNQQSTNLAARVAMLESRLGLVGQNMSNPSPASDEHFGSEEHQSRARNPAFNDNEPSAAYPNGGVEANSKFSVVPDLRALRAATDVYFANCQNQPYSYFHEAAFRQRLEDGRLPSYLLMIFMATAARYSTDEFWEGQQFEAIEIYAKTAWRDILKQAFYSDVSLDLYTVQATNMLAVIDFTAGRHRLGWVKIGLAVRFAQGLRLNAEPDSSLPVWQQEEHRRVFWSVYLLDKLVSCCRNRPPTILDDDCSVRLPCSEKDFRAESGGETPSLEFLNRLPDISAYKGLDHFALMIITASILGRIMRYSLQQTPVVAYPHWDSRSDFAKIYSMLLSFESLMTVGDDNFTHYINSSFTTNAAIDKQRAGHCIWARGLYHLCHCLLHHPLLLRRCLRRYRDTCPRSFLVESVRRGWEHAQHLTSMLRTVQQTDCCAHGSFLGYFAVVSGTIHRLNQHSKDDITRARASQFSQSCLEFLCSQPVQWENYPRMGNALKDFAINPDSARALIDPSTLLKDDERVDLDNLWCILDYGWLSDASRSTGRIQPANFPNIDSPSWSIFEDLFADQLLAEW